MINLEIYLRMKCKQLGYQINDLNIEKILDKTHELITLKKFITEEELEEIIKNIIE